MTRYIVKVLLTDGVTVKLIHPLKETDDYNEAFEHYNDAIWGRERGKELAIYRKVVKRMVS
jgi:hypothetical protein